MSSDEDLLVFGYASRIYSPDDRSDFIAEEQHLIVSPSDPSLRIDRYDCRLLLPTGFDVNVSSTLEESCPTEDLEEEMCDEERYRDMIHEVPETHVEEVRPQKAEIAYDYKNDNKANGSSTDLVCDDSDSETEPFEPPPGIKLPLGLAVPENQKQNHIIERTALFVVTKGPQMEIVIKAKQRNNTEQFGFLEFDNVLHPYYKYLSKLIREKKYTPDLAKRPKRPPQREQVGEQDMSTGGSTTKDNKSNALTALADQHGSDSDSDSDCELHPSLLSGMLKRGRSPDVMDAAENAVGPRRRPISPSPPPVTAHRHDYDMSKSNDIYASLFKSLSQVSVEREEAEKRQKEKLEIQKHIMASAPPPPDEEYRAWWLSFYGTPCPYSSPQPMVPPPPDLQPVISSYADFVARHGVEAELDLRDRADLQLNFMHPTSPHFSYYQHRVRMVQWELAQKVTDEPPKSDVSETETGVTPVLENVSIEGVIDDTSIPTTSSTVTCDQESPVPAMNRKQRRRLQDGFQVATCQPIGIVDPVASITAPDIFTVPKVSTSPGLLSSTPVVNTTGEESGSDETCTNNVGVAAPRPFPVPVSFTLAPIRDENPVFSSKLVTSEDSSGSILVDPRTLSPLSVPQQASVTAPQVHVNFLVAFCYCWFFVEKYFVILPPPVPPNILSNTQLDRKEKARIFMERLLNEKRVKKLREQEEARIKELEAQKAEIERQLAEEEVKRKKTSLAMVDKLINSRIGALLGQVNTESEVKAKLPARLSDDEADKDRDEMRRKRKKDKIKKHKHRKSRSRSRSRDRDRRRRRRSSDSRSSDRDSRKRKKERR
ncbi:surp module [Dictyocaulus viviparus]|uniref:Surp module n=1 Tax=Dictyocaulus viviparus TaxID=29172 RepID=A0A0D8Y3K0_DICVI|nr:surp module [Dictyocaulus viviparus]